MPKILTNVREALIAESRRQIDENGYAAMTIRSVASACGIATGTVYNYFPSKDMLIASFMREDWKKELDIMHERVEGETDPMKAVAVVYEGLHHFFIIHHKLFEDPQAGEGYKASFSERHMLLVSQLTSIIGPICSEKAKTKDAPVCDFIVESLLAWIMQGRPVDDYYKIVKDLF